jgi:hypothetical protein
MVSLDVPPPSPPLCDGGGAGPQDLAFIMCRNSRCRGGHMGCVIVKDGRVLGIFLMGGAHAFYSFVCVD